MSTENTNREPLRKGEFVTIKPQWLDPGETARIYLVVDDENDMSGNVRITDPKSTLRFPGIETIRAEYVERYCP